MLRVTLSSLLIDVPFNTNYTCRLFLATLLERLIQRHDLSIPKLSILLVRCSLPHVRRLRYLLENLRTGLGLATLRLGLDHARRSGGLG